MRMFRIIVCYTEAYQVESIHGTSDGPRRRWGNTAITKCGLVQEGLTTWQSTGLFRY